MKILNISFFAYKTYVNEINLDFELANFFKNKTENDIIERELADIKNDDTDFYNALKLKALNNKLKQIEQITGINPSTFKNKYDKLKYKIALEIIKEQSKQIDNLQKKIDKLSDIIDKNL